MEKEKMEGLIIDYIDNKLNTVDRQTIEQELVRNPEAYKLYEELKEVMLLMDKAGRMEPSTKLKSNFDEMLESEMKASPKGKIIFFQPAFYRVAAAVALLVIGGGIGFWISKENDQAKRIAAIEEKMEENKRLMMSMIGNQNSASQRIQGLNVAMTIDKTDDEVVKALVKAMNEDSNSNVRLAALEALSKFSNDPHVRKILIGSLATQKDPIVQIALIQLMVQMKEKGIVNDLQKIVEDSETMQAVKDEAYSGILKLS
jgi:hypothetical protein